MLELEVRGSESRLGVQAAIVCGETVFVVASEPTGEPDRLTSASQLYVGELPKLNGRPAIPVMTPYQALHLTLVPTSWSTAQSSSHGGSYNERGLMPVGPIDAGLKQLMPGDPSASFIQFEGAVHAPHEGFAWRPSLDDPTYHAHGVPLAHWLGEAFPAYWAYFVPRGEGLALKLDVPTSTSALPPTK